ncbi:MAG TPA: PEP-CTERM sorting domain-containing protein [Gemmataceae bacterium]|jgi:hypothetical protein|nr:PEP-CTERM sorting domain-containing protein [Gemmataceae bacterium]
MKRWLVGLAAVALVFGGVSQASASFILHFDENGNAFYNSTTGGIVGPNVPIVGTVMTDPSSGTPGLTYMLPELVTNGDVSVFNANPSTAPVLSDLMRFTNAQGNLSPGVTAPNITADRMIFYSVKDDGSTTSDGLADLPFTTLPANANGSVNEIQSEPTTGLVNFDWLPNGVGGNEYVGISDTPEPATLTLLAIGIAGMAGYGWCRRKAAAA